MALKDILKTAIMEDLKQADMLKIQFYGIKNQETLNFLYRRGVIDDSSIESALEVVVLNQARQDYTMVTNKRTNFPTSADQISRPDCLAYALDKGKFSPEEIKKIPFDHGASVETYCKRYGKENLISIVKEELFNSKPLPKFQR